MTAHLHVGVERKSQSEDTERFSNNLICVICVLGCNRVYLKVLPSLICNDFPIQTSAPLSVLTASFLFVIMMIFILHTFPRSTLHQGLDCVWVRVQELCPKFESLFPSTALPATAEPLVGDWSALLSSAKFLRGSPYKYIQISIMYGNHIIYSRGKHSLPASIPGVSIKDMPE